MFGLQAVAIPADLGFLIAEPVCCSGLQSWTAVGTQNKEQIT